MQPLANNKLKGSFVAEEGEEREADSHFLTAAVWQVLVRCRYIPELTRH